MCVLKTLGFVRIELKVKVVWTSLSIFDEHFSNQFENGNQQCWKSNPLGLGEYESFTSIPRDDLEYETKCLFMLYFYVYSLNGKYEIHV